MCHGINNLLKISVVLILLILLAGCSSGGQNPLPTAPDQNPGSGDSSINGSVTALTDSNSETNTGQSAESGHFLLGYSLIYIDATNPDDVIAEMVPLRESEIHLNILKLLEDGPCTNCFKIVEFNFPVPGTLNVDIQIDHPFGDLLYSVFDVRGIMMFQGSHTFPVAGKAMSDPVLGDGALLNADGYTALFNGSTVTAPVGVFQKYYPGNYATVAVPNSIINGYKYYVTDNPSNNRNAFYGDSSGVDVQTFSIKLPTGPFVLGYAVDANWWLPISEPVDDPLTDFDLNANCPEPWKVVVTEVPIGDGLTDHGGQTKLLIDVYDWQGKSTHHDPVIECPELFDDTLSATWLEDGSGYARYEVTLSNANLTSTGDYMCLVNVEANENNPIGKPWLDLTAYMTKYLTVSPFMDQSPVAIAAADPNPQQTGNPVHLFDDGSFDPDGGLITKYEWDIGADGSYEIEGSETWYTENYPGIYLVQLRVTDDDGSTDLLDTPLEVEFTEEPILLTAPNGGEHWKVQNSEDITWIADPDILNVQIMLSLDSGSNYTYSISDSTPNDGSFTWDPIPLAALGDLNRIKIIDVDNTNVFDESDADFEVYDEPILVTYPNGGEVWKVGQSPEITWEADPSIVNVKIETSSDSGGTYPITIVDSTPNTGVFQLDPLPPEAISDYSRIKVSDVDNPAVYDESDADYSIIDAWIDIISPNGGENWEVGSSHDITWECSETGGTVSIIYTKDDFNSDFHDINTAAPNTGIFTWDSIPDDTCDTVKVGIQFNGLEIFGGSDDYFSIIDPQPSITVTAPNGWEELRAGNSFEITWDSQNVTGLISISYSKDNFVSDIISINDGDTNTGSWVWDIPYDLSDTAKIRVESYSDPSINDVSDNNFHLTDGGWADTWGTSEEDYGEEVVIDGFGNTYVTGYEGTSPTVAFLRKYDPAGYAQWTLTWGAEGLAAAYGLAVDSDSNVYVTGSFFGTNVDMDPGLGTALRTSDANGDIFLSRFGPSGNFSYVKTWGGWTGGFVEAGKDIMVNGTDLYVTGFFTGTTVDFNPDSVGTDWHDSHGGTDAFLSKFNTDGTFIWADTWGGTDSSNGDEGHGISFDGDGNIDVAGRFYGTNVDFDPDPVGSTLKSSVGGSDAFLVWFDTTGDFHGVWTWGGTGYDSAESVIMGASGSFVAGQFEGSNVDFNPDSGTDLKSSAGLKDAFLMHFNALLAYQFTVTWGGTGEDIATDLATDENLYPIVVGGFSGTVDFDPGAGSDLRYCNGEYDAYWTSLDADGNFLMAQTWGGANIEASMGVATSDTGRIFVTGSSESPSVEYAPTGSPCFDNSYSLTTYGGYDPFLIKYMPDGCW